MDASELRRSAEARRFSAAYARHSREILAYAGRRCESLPEAADVLAETMLIAWRRIDAMPQEPDTRLWLYAVSRNVIANSRRSSRRRRRLGSKLREQLVAVEPELELVNPELAMSVRAALGRLPEVEREVMLLSVSESLSPREIAVVLEMNASTVRTHLQRAREKLRRNLGEDRLFTERLP